MTTLVHAERPDPGDAGDIRHTPVLARQIVDGLRPGPDRRIVDATCGLGGHSELLLAAGATVLAIDRDAESLAKARRRLQRFVDDGRFTTVHEDYRQLSAILAAVGWDGIDGLVADLGVSTYQLLTGERGLSFQHDGPLDMRLDRSRGVTAAELVATASAVELTRLLRQYGEEPRARRIAEAIVAARDQAEITTTAALAAIVCTAVPPRHVTKSHLHPATLTFQALRIAVNDELTGIDRFVSDAITALKPGGRLAVIAFHSLEDRQVKTALRDEAAGCICPPALVGCGCGHVARIRLLGRRAVQPDAEEQRANPRARSARLRVAERLADGDGR